MCGLETTALTEKQQGKLQVCENNWIRRITRVKRANKRRMDELRVEVGVKESVKKKLVRSRLTLASHVERIGDEKLANRSEYYIISHLNHAVIYYQLHHAVIYYQPENNVVLLP